MPKSKIQYINHIHPKIKLCKPFPFHKSLDDLFKFIDSDPYIQEKFIEAFPKAKEKLRSRDREILKTTFKQGWADDITWSLAKDLSIVDFILPRLKRYKEIILSVVAEENIGELESMLNKIIAAFELCQDNVSPFDDDQEKIYNEGMKLFVENFRGLWW